MMQTNSLNEDIEKLFLQPVLHLQTRHTGELPGISGHYGKIFRKGMGCDEQVIGPDECSLTHQMVA